MLNTTSLFAKHGVILQTSSNGLSLESSDSLHVTLVRLARVASEYLGALHFEVQQPFDTTLQESRRPRGKYREYLRSHPEAWPLIVKPGVQLVPKQSFPTGLAKVAAGLDLYPVITSELVLKIAQRVDLEFFGKRLSNVIKFTLQSKDDLCLVFGISSDDDANGWFDDRNVDHSSPEIRINPRRFMKLTPESLLYLGKNTRRTITSRLDALIATICHEMVHALIWASDDYDSEEQRQLMEEDSQNHGEFFRELMMGIFGYYTTQSKYTPTSRLLRPPGPVATRYTVSKGDRVAYYHNRNSKLITASVYDYTDTTLVIQDDGVTDHVKDIEYQRVTLLK